MVTRWTTGMVCVLALGLATQAQAAYSDSFDALRAELSVRSSVLSNSDDKVEIKQYKACLKAIAAIDKSNTLAKDVKTAAKVTKALAKAFTNEFSVVTASMETVSFATNLNFLCSGVFSNLADEVQSALDDLQTAINGLPEGVARATAQSVHDAAQALLNDNAGNPDLLAFAKGLATTLKDVIKGTKIVIKGTGGSVGNATLKCSINGNAFQGIGAAGVYVSATGQFGVVGATAQKSVNVAAFNVTGPGTYPADTGCFVYELSTGTTYGNNVTGTVTFTTLDFTTKKAIGTFSFTADYTSGPGAGSVNVTAGQFNVNFP